MVLPGTHLGPTYDHHADGRFCGAMNPADCDLDFGKAVPLMGPAGSMTIHHARLVHGSALNTSNQQRRLLLHEYTAADAWPLMGIANFDEFNSRMVLGEPPSNRASGPRRYACRCRRPTTRARSTRTSAPPGGASSRPSTNVLPMSTKLARRSLLIGAALGLAPWRAASAAESLKIGAGRGTIDFAIGDSRVFRTTGSFKEWQGTVHVDDADVPRSSVEVIVRTGSVQMLDNQQTSMLKDADFFDVEKFPQMTFRSNRITRTGETTLKVEGEVTLRGVTRPMTLDVSVTNRRADAAPGTRYAYFRGQGSIKRSEFGMTKFVDVVGDNVEITINTDAWR